MGTGGSGEAPNNRPRESSETTPDFCLPGKDSAVTPQFRSGKVAGLRCASDPMVGEITAPLSSVKWEEV